MKKCFLVNTCIVIHVKASITHYCLPVFKRLTVCRKCIRYKYPTYLIKLQPPGICLQQFPIVRKELSKISRNTSRHSASYLLYSYQHAQSILLLFLLDALQTMYLLTSLPFKQISSASWRSRRLSSASWRSVVGKDNSHVSNVVFLSWEFSRKVGK